MSAKTFSTTHITAVYYFGSPYHVDAIHTVLMRIRTVMPSSNHLLTAMLCSQSFHMFYDWY
jgi:hypothetical protein